MRMNLLVYFPFILLLLQDGTVAQMDLITTLASTPEVSQFLSHLRDSKITALNTSTCLNSETCITVLAPNNAAWTVQMNRIAWPSLTLEQKQQIMYGQYLTSPKTGSIPVRLSQGNWQTVGTALPLIDVGFGKGSMFTELRGPRYAFSSIAAPTNYFINDAKVVTPDITATNGIIQVMDKVVYYPHEMKPFYNYLQETPELSKTFELWKKLLTNGNPLYMELTSQTYSGVNLYATYFVVPNSVWNQIPPKIYADILNNEALLVDVLSYHYAPNQLFYPRWSGVKNQVDFYVGFPTNPLPSVLVIQKLTPGTLTSADGNTQPMVNVKSTVAVTIGEAVVLNRAVLIQVSAPLGYLYETTQAVLARISPTFLKVCTANTACKTILQSTSEKTVFAPSEWTAFNNLPVESQGEYLQLMIFSERILRPQMTMDKYITVGATQNAVRFRRFKGLMHIEARLANHGYVGIPLTNTESSGSDGIVYLINGVPGLSTQTCQQMLTADPIYADYVNTAILAEQKIGGPYTYLAPTTTAINAMKADTTVGAVILSQQERKIYVLRRLIFPVALLLNDMTSPAEYDVPTANFAFTRELVRFSITTVKTNNVAKLTFNASSTTASFSNGGYECTDGWIYPVDKVLYTMEDLTRDLTGEAYHQH